MKTIKYEYADGRIDDIEVNDEVADFFDQRLEYEKITERRETKKRFSLERAIDLGFDFEDRNANIDAILIKKDNAKRELGIKKKAKRFLRREKKWLTTKLTLKQAKAYFQFFYLKRKKVDIAIRMGISEGAVRKLIIKAENNLEKTLLKEADMNEKAVKQHKIDRDTFKQRLTKELLED